MPCSTSSHRSGSRPAAATRAWARMGSIGIVISLLSKLCTNVSQFCRTANETSEIHHTIRLLFEIFLIDYLLASCLFLRLIVQESVILSVAASLHLCLRRCLASTEGSMTSATRPPADLRPRP